MLSSSPRRSVILIGNFPFAQDYFGLRNGKPIQQLYHDKVQEAIGGGEL